MPKILYTNINNYTKLAVWQINEPLEFFKLSHIIPANITNESKKIEWVVSRFLLTELENGLKLEEIYVNDFGKPLYNQNKYYFSISHSKKIVAIIISSQKNVSLDIQKIIPKTIFSVKHKFLSTQELSFIVNYDLEIVAKLLTICWCVKETIYKHVSIPNIIFKTDILIDLSQYQMNQSTLQVYVLTSKSITKYKIEIVNLQNYCLTYIN